jgi:integrase
MTSGLNMHRARHTFATDLRRVADLGAASQALGHSDLSTTAAIYGYSHLSDRSALWRHWPVHVVTKTIGPAD